VLDQGEHGAKIGQVGRKIMPYQPLLQR
jgi:hypothetical protein